MLSLDHLIIRVADPATVLADLARCARLPVLAEATEVGGLTSAIARAGAIDIEVLAIGAEPPAAPQGYGLGFVADGPLEDALTGIRALGIATSAPVSARAGHGADARRWRAAQVHGLLDDPFPITTTTRPFGAADRRDERVGSLLARIPGMARRATRDPGASMVVVTEYGFDAEALRAGCPPGPAVVEVHVDVGGHLGAWSRLLGDDAGPLRLHARQPCGVTRVVLSAEADAVPAAFRCGTVDFDFRATRAPAVA
jgi:hypothetical protein